MAQKPKTQISARRGYRCKTVRTGYKAGKALTVDYFENNVEELNDCEQLDLINVVTSTFYDEAIKPGLPYLISGTWLKGRTNKHTILYTDDPGELAEDPEAPKEEPDDKEAPKKEKDIPEDEESNDVTMETGCQSPEWKDGLRTLSPSIIRPAPLWWEGECSRVVTFVPREPEMDVADMVKNRLEAEFPHALGKDVEEYLADEWEEMEEEGLVGSVEDNRAAFNSLLADTQIDLAHLSTAFFRKRLINFIEGSSTSLKDDLSAALQETLVEKYKHSSDDTSSEDSEPLDEDQSVTPEPAVHRESLKRSCKLKCKTSTAEHKDLPPKKKRQREDSTLNNSDSDDPSSNLSNKRVKIEKKRTLVSQGSSKKTMTKTRSKARSDVSKTKTRRLMKLKHNKTRSDIIVKSEQESTGSEPPVGNDEAISATTESSTGGNYNTEVIQ